MFSVYFIIRSKDVIIYVGTKIANLLNSLCSYVGEISRKGSLKDVDNIIHISV